MITYYQRGRHIFGRLELEVLDNSGKVIDTLDAPKCRGINRVILAPKTHIRLDILKSANLHRGGG